MRSRVRTASLDSMTHCDTERTPEAEQDVLYLHKTISTCYHDFLDTWSRRKFFHFLQCLRIDLNVHACSGLRGVMRRHGSEYLGRAESVQKEVYVG